MLNDGLKGPCQFTRHVGHPPLSSPSPSLETPRVWEAGFQIIGAHMTMTCGGHMEVSDRGCSALETPGLGGCGSPPATVLSWGGRGVRSWHTGANSGQSGLWGWVGVSVHHCGTPASTSPLAALVCPAPLVHTIPPSPTSSVSPSLGLS